MQLQQEYFPPHFLPIMDLKRMIYHIEETLPSTLHLPVSSEDTLHFYQYLCTHVLISSKKFLLLIDIPIQDQLHQLSIYKISLWISHMVILQLTMTSILNFSELHGMKLWQWRFCHDTSRPAKMQMDNFVLFLHHFSH